MEIKIETITPERAKEILSRQKGNRPLSNPFVDYLVREIQTNNWCLTHQGICFDEAGNLTDGHHRLTAIAKSGRSVTTVVSYGVPRESSLRAVDQGRPRTRGQLFIMRGEKNGVLKASICRSMSILLNPDLQYSASLGPSEDASILEKYRTSIEAVINQKITGQKHMSARFYAGAALLHNHDENTGLSYITGVLTGINLDEGDPRLTLRNWLLGSTANRMSSSADGAGIIAKTACSISAFIDNEKLKALQTTAKRYARFCELLELPVNKSLFTYCGGTLLPAKKTNKIILEARELEPLVETLDNQDPSDSRDLTPNQLKFIRDWT
jgi:hypothetical protein